MQIAPLVFKRQFDHFEQQVVSESSQSFRSFHQGLPSDWEEYKDRVWHEAQEQLAVNTWKEKDVGTGRIRDAVISAIEIKRSKTLRNNLVQWEGKHGPKSRSHLAIIEASGDVAEQFEQWAFAFYGDDVNPKSAFEELVGLVGKRYDLVAYLFFLKDRHRFLPIGTTTIDQAFSMLGVDLVTTRKCSWENYSHFIATISEVQRLLVDVAGVTNVSLLDAHSFCWLLAKLDGDAGSGIEIPAPKLLSNLAAATVKPRDEPAEFNVFTEEDFARKEENQRRLGRLAQDIALASEERRLREAGHLNPSEVVFPVWDEPGRGYDILSAELDNSPRHIEVKAARRATDGTLKFIVSSNEIEKSRSLANYWFYLIVGTDSESPEILLVSGQDVLEEYLTARTFEASFSAERE